MHRQENLANKTLVRDMLSRALQQAESMHCVMILHKPTEVTLQEMGLLDTVKPKMPIAIQLSAPTIHNISAITLNTLNVLFNRASSFFCIVPVVCAVFFVIIRQARRGGCQVLLLPTIFAQNINSNKFFVNKNRCGKHLQKSFFLLQCIRIDLSIRLVSQH